jgi:drug/metabolite transporter (DMT)-like permease
MRRDLSRLMQAPTRQHPGAGTRQAEVGLLLLVLLWAFNFSVIKIGLAVIPPMGFNALRFPLAALFLGAVLMGMGRLTLPARGDIPRIVVLGIVGNVAYQLLFISGMALSRAGNASVLLTTSPIFITALTATLGHERIRPAAWAGIGATLAGIVLVVGAGEDGFRFGAETLKGDLLLVGAAAVWSIYTVGARNPIRKYGSVRMTAWTVTVGSVFLLLIGLPDILSLETEITPLAWTAVVYAGFLGLGLSYLLWYQGVKVLGNTRTAAFGNLVPVFAILMAWPLLGEVPNLWQLGGAAVIIGGVSIVRRATENL